MFDQVSLKTSYRAGFGWEQFGFRDDLRMRNRYRASPAHDKMSPSPQERDMFTCI